MRLPDPVERELERQRLANRSGRPHAASFTGHRDQITARVVADVPEASSARLCVLGAGNCLDLELSLLLEHFAEIHLVDLDLEAITGARARLRADQQARVVLHAPLELSGMLAQSDRYRAFQVTPEELAGLPAAATRAIVDALPGPFEVVLSSCLLTQLQLGLLDWLGDQHRLFPALRELLTLLHLRTLFSLLTTGGQAQLVTDLCEARVFPAGRPRDAADLPRLMQELVQQGHVVYASHPGVLGHAFAVDPLLTRARDLHVSEPWLWQNGPSVRFMVYGFSFRRAG